ncbi:MAG: hypothetical protein WCG25_01220 [bacterium]
MIVDSSLLNRAKTSQSGLLSFFIISFSSASHFKKYPNSFIILLKLISVVS